MFIESPAFPVIDALVTRHAEDAAFYWFQLDGAVKTPTIRLDRLQYFNDLLDAHLDGLLVAGNRGWKRAMDALTRWNKPGEAFVCMWLAAQIGGQQRLEEILNAAQPNPQNVLRGMISALAWLPSSCSTSIINRWGTLDAVPIAQVIALRAVALIGPEAITALRSPLQDFLASPHAHVRAAACRVLAGGCQGMALAALRDALTDPDTAVRAEAAIALSVGTDSDRALKTLLRCVIDQVSAYAAATGWHRMQAARRLERWVRELAWQIPFGKGDTHAILSALPPRAALTFALVHGDPRHLPFVAEIAALPEVSRYAGWVWQALTGIDLAAAGLTLPAQPSDMLPADQLITEARLDADNGLPQVNAAALREHTASNPSRYGDEGPILLGRTMDRHRAAEVVRSGPQALRLLAARKLGDSPKGMTVRGPVHPQLAALACMPAAATGVTV